MSIRRNPSCCIFLAIGLAVVSLSIASCKAMPDRIVAPELTEAERLQRDLNEIYELASRGLFAEAEALLGGLIERYPERLEFQLLDASLLISMGELAAASQAVGAILEQDPNHLDALFIKAELDGFAGNQAARSRSLERILSLDSGYVAALSAMGSIQYDSKNYSRAEAHYRQALSIQPTNVEALIGLSRIQFRRREFTSALSNLDKALESAPLDALIYLDRSRVLYQLGRYTDCEADLSRSIELQPSAWAHLERGRLFLDTGRHGPAEADFTAAIALEPGFFLPYVYRAGIYELTGKDTQALADYRRVTELNTDYWFAWESIGVLAFRTAQWADAHAAFNRAAGFTTNHPEYYVAAGLALMMNNEIRAARDYAGRMLPRINRDTHPAQWLLLRQIVDQSTNTGDIEQHINRERSLDTKAGLLFYLGQYWVARGQAQLGLRYLNMSLESNRQETIEWRMAEASVQRLAESGQ